MAAFIVLGTLAAFGALCALWALFGFLLPGQQGAAAVCLCKSGGAEEPIIRRYRWLRGMGLVRCPLLLVDCGLTEEERSLLLRSGDGIMICTPEELSFKLEQERNRLG